VDACLMMWPTGYTVSADDAISFCVRCGEGDDILICLLWILMAPSFCPRCIVSWWLALVSSMCRVVVVGLGVLDVLCRCFAHVGDALFCWRGMMFLTV